MILMSPCILKPAGRGARPVGGMEGGGEEGVEASIIPLCGVSSLGNGARGSVRKLVK